MESRVDATNGIVEGRTIRPPVAKVPKPRSSRKSSMESGNFITRHSSLTGLSNATPTSRSTLVASPPAVTPVTKISRPSEKILPKSDEKKIPCWVSRPEGPAKVRSEEAGPPVPQEKTVKLLKSPSVENPTAASGGWKFLNLLTELLHRVAGSAEPKRTIPSTS